MSVSEGRRISNPVKSEPASAKQNFSWLSMGNLAFTLSQAGILVVLANLTSQEDVGEYTLALAVAGPIVLFAEFRIRETLATDARQEFRFAEYLGFTMITSALAMFVIAGVGLLLYGSSVVLRSVLLVGLIKVVESLGNVAYGLQQRELRMKEVAISMVMRGLFGLAGLAIGVLAFGELRAGLLSWLLAWTAVLFLYDLPRALRLAGAIEGSRAKLKFQAVAKLLLRVFPLGVTSIVISLTATVPRLVLERSAGLEELGVFGVVAYSVVAASTFARAISQALAPAMAKFFVSGNTLGFRKLALRSVLATGSLGLVGLICAIFFGSAALGFIFGDEYSSGATALALVMTYGVFLFSSMPLTQAMVASRQMYRQVPLFLIVLIVVTGASLWAVPVYGIEGAAVALIAAGAVRFLGSLLLLRGPLGIGKPRRELGGLA